MIINSKRIDSSLKQLIKQSKKLDDYLTIEKELAKGNCSKNTKLQDTFCRLYDNDHRHPFIDGTIKNTYFSIMESNYKKVRKGMPVSFIEIYKEIENKTGKRSIVYTSKMLHTIDNNYPIWDSVLVSVSNFNLNNSETGKWTDEEVKYAYDNYCKEFNSFLKKKEAKTIIKEFDKTFLPINPDYLKINKIKKIDFVLWKNK